MNGIEGNSKIIAVYKPSGPTSHDIVDRVRRATGVKKVGHAGTLDPLARGVLVVAIGRQATKKIAEIVAKEKEYMAQIKLGMTSMTDDEEGEKETVKIPNSKFQIPNESQITKVVREFIGEIEQTPPVYSAVKIKGQEAYKRARRGEDVRMKSRQVEIKEIEILKYEWPVLGIRVVTGAGVYIRSLARDIGEKLGVAGYLVDLERTRVGEFGKEDAVRLEELKGVRK